MYICRIKLPLVGEFGPRVQFCGLLVEPVQSNQPSHIIIISFLIELGSAHSKLKSEKAPDYVNMKQ